MRFTLTIASAVDLSRDVLKVCSSMYVHMCVFVMGNYIYIQVDLLACQICGENHC